MQPINPAFSRNPKPPALAGGDFTNKKSAKLKNRKISPMGEKTKQLYL